VLKSKEDDILLLDDYIKSRLSEIDKITVESRLLTESDLKEDYDYLKAVANASRANVLQDKLKMLQEEELIIKTASESKDAAAIHQLEPVKNNDKIWWKVGLVAGLLGVMPLIGKYYIENQGPKYPAEYADLFENRFEEELILHTTYRSVEPTDTYTPEQRRAYELYSIKEFEMAAPLLENLWEDKRDTLALFYWGVSEIGRGEVEEGKEILHKKELHKYENLSKSLTK
jgi:hypothetical protein